VTDCEPAGTPQALELRHLRYFVALADAGNFTIPPGLPESLALSATAGLRAAAAATDVDLAWLETALDPEFSLISTRRADVGLGWLTEETVPAALEVMTVGEFEPEVWVPPAHTAAPRGTISMEELATLQVIHGPRRAQPGTYDAWVTALQAVDPRFEFTDPPFRHSLAMTLALAAAGNRPAAVLTGPAIPARTQVRPIRLARLADTYGMVRVILQHHPPTAAAALVWSGDLPRPLQQLLFDTADSLTGPAHPHSADLTPVNTG
jgi:DNA-binding transcriptional LysR family regulator